MWLIGVILIPTGIMLAYYLPAIPLVIWVMAVINYFILWLKVIALIPIAGMMNSLPGGETMIHQRVHQAMMIIVSLVFTPPLIVIGFFSSILLMIIAGHIINIIFLPFISSMNSDNTMGAFGLLATLSLYVIIIITVAHRVFGIISEFKDEILRFLGGGLENLGESNAEKETKQTLVGGISKVGEARRISNERNRVGGGNQNKNSGTPDPKNINKSLRGR